jgi:hypothetical protein
MLDLVEKIYQAAAIPELWPDALEVVSRRIGAAGCSFIAIDRAAPVWVSSPGQHRPRSWSAEGEHASSVVWIRAREATGNPDARLLRRVPTLACLLDAAPWSHGTSRPLLA